MTIVNPGNADQGVTGASFGNALTRENGAIPLIFSKKLAVAYGTKGMGVTDNLTNDNYAGEISQQGDTVRIVVPVVPGDDAIAFGSGAEVCPTFQSVAPQSLDMVIDKVATFGLAIDDVQKAQTQFKAWLDGQASAYGEKLKYLRNREIAQYAFMAAAPNSHTFADGGNGGTLNAPLTTINSQNIFIHLLKVKEALIKSGAVGADGVYSFKPMEEEARDERAVLVVTPEMHTLIMSSYRVGGRSVDMADVVVKDGAITRVAGMDIIIDKSLNELKQTTTTTTGETVATTTACTGLPFLAGTKNAITKAQQISKVESVRDPYCFRDLIKGLDLYGYKLVHPEALYRGVISNVTPSDAVPTISVTP